MKKNVIVKTYKGSESSAAAAFQADAVKMAAQGYFPSAQNWAPGSYGCGSFVFALILCVLIIGILIFIYMLLVKPDGTLTVTYSLGDGIATPDTHLRCPDCAEFVLKAARVCKHCGCKLVPQS